LLTNALSNFFKKIIKINEKLGSKMNQIEKFKKEKNQLITESEIESKLGILVNGQTNNSKELQAIRNDLQRGFIELALRNEELLKSNEQLKQQLEIMVSELNAIKKEREEKAARREKWANRKRLPKRDPINSEIYNLLIKESEGPTYIATRTRIAICLLTVTGIRIGELLALKVGQLETLVEEGWISIDRLKRGPANHKAFLTSEGKRIIKLRKRDFEFLFLMKDNDSYVFSSDRKPNQMLRRQTITMDVNKVMHSVSNLLPSKPNITSHSFRIGYNILLIYGKYFSNMKIYKRY
jgi:integrase